MPTLRTQVGNPGARREVGQKVLSAAAVVDVKRIKVRLAAFKRAHEAFVRASDKVQAAEAVRDAAHAAVAAADVVQDSSIDVLVLALVTAGAPRLSPLKGLSTYSPSDLKSLATAKEAKELQKVVAAITKKGAAKGALRKPTKAANDAAAAVLKAIASVVPRERLYQESLAERDALSQPWETALAYLKRAVRVAEDDGATGLFAALFERTAEAPKKKPAKGAAPVA